MFRAITQAQWKASRGFVLLATACAFALPLLALRSAVAAGVWQGAFLQTAMGWGVMYPVAAGGIGLVLAIVAWSPDHRGRHVYALTLPVQRWRYVLLRLGAGTLFLVPPVLALLVAGEIAARSPSIPVGLHAYPVALAARFALACAVAYALFFAITAATARTAGIILGAIGVLIAAQYLLSSVGVRQEHSVATYVFDVLFAAPGLLAVFNGRWLLFDA